MASHYDPVIKIGGIVIDPHWSAVNPTALQPITIEWGASGHFDEVPPAALRLEIVHPIPVTNTHQYQGRYVEIEVDGARTYRGKVDSTTWRRVLVWDEDTQQNQPYWIATIRVVDPTTEVRAFRPVANPVPDSTSTSWRQENMWRKQVGRYPYFGIGSAGTGALTYFRSTVDQLQAAGIVSDVRARWDSYADTGFHKRAAIDEPTAWELIRETYATVPLAEPCYSAAGDTIAVTSPATRPPVRLVFSAGKLMLDDSGGLRVLDASILEVDDDMPVATDSTVNIGRIELDGWFFMHQWVDYSTDTEFLKHTIDVEERKIFARTVPGSSGEGAVYRRPTNIAMRTRTPYDSSEIDATYGLYNTAQTLDRTAALVASLNGQIAQPDVTIDLGRDSDSLSPALVTTLLQSNPAEHREPILVIGSAASREMGLDAFVQVIGGTLAYTSEGWRHTLRFAPVPRSTAPPLTIAQIVTSPTATYDSYADNIILDLFASITQGAS